MFCLNCSSETSFVRLCDLCRRSLRPPSQEFDQGASLYEYESVLRSLVIRAKVRCDLQALLCLIELFLQQPATENELQRCQVIMPVPSSLRGRLRGSWDLAFALAKAAADTRGIPLILPPQTCYWKLSKQSFKTKRTPVRLNFPERADRIRTLLIDDVITSGFSLQNLVRKLCRNTCRFLVLANASRGYPLR